MRSASGLASGTAAYRYHADGSRREKTALGATTQFFYMGGLGYLDEEDTQFAADQEIAEYSGATLLRRYIRLPGSVDETFLMIDLTLDASCTTTSYATCERWAQTDRIGSVVASLDSAGAVLEKYRYSPYGVSGWEGAIGFPFRFTGQKLDPETGLYYYKARYYDPETGRFLQTDPIGYEDQMNLYAYVGNDPLNVTDPTGEFGLAGAIYGGISGAVGGYIASGSVKGAIVGGVAGAAVGFVLPGASGAVGAAAASGLGSIAGQVAGGIADNQTLGEAVRNVDLGAAAGAALGGGLAKGIGTALLSRAPRHISAVVGAELSAGGKVTQPAGNSAAAVIEGAFAGAGEVALGPQGRPVIIDTFQAVGDAISDVFQAEESDIEEE